MVWLMLAYDFPLLSVFWTILGLFLVLALIMVLFHVIADVFRNRDIGGVGKAVWLVVIVFLPVIGVVVYLVSHGAGMSSRHVSSYVGPMATDNAIRASYPRSMA